MRINRIDLMWEELTQCGIATEEELELVTTINGYNEESMYDVLYVRTGERTFEFEKDEE